MTPHQVAVDNVLTVLGNMMAECAAGRIAREEFTKLRDEFLALAFSEMTESQKEAVLQGILGMHQIVAESIIEDAGSVPGNDPNQPT